MPFSGGKFSPPGSKKPAMKPAQKQAGQSAQGESKSGSKPKPAGEEHGQQGQEVQHVTKTHPGETQPHPVTGVHAFHAHHTGGGKFKSHTHHNGGEVETREHNNVDEMQQAGSEVFPPDGGGSDERNGDLDFANELEGVGGGESSGSY